MRGFIVIPVLHRAALSVVALSLGLLALGSWSLGAPAEAVPAGAVKSRSAAAAKSKPADAAKPRPVKIEYRAEEDDNLPYHNCRAIFACSSRGTYFRQGEKLLEKARAEGESKAFILMAQSALQIGAKSYNTGFDLAKQAVTLAPNEPMIQAQMGWAYMFKEDDKSAREWFLKAAKNPKADFDTLCSCSAAFKDLDDVDGRVVAATALVKKYSHYTNSQHDMTMALVDSRRFKEAEPYAKKTLAMNSKLREAWFGMCEVDRGLGRWREVLKDCDGVIACGFAAQSRKSVIVFRYKAEAYEMLHEWDNAVKAWTIAIEKTPGTRQYYVHRGDCYKKLGDMKRAQADWASAKDLDSGLD